LKSLIRAQLCGDITTCEFDVGFVSGTNVVSIRSEEDLAEIWSSQLKGDKIVLWCDWLASSGASCKRKTAVSDSEDSETVPNPKKKTTRGREDRVQEALDALKKEHGDKYTVMQYHIWSEMIAGGMHGNTSEPPTTSVCEGWGY
jgi:hypothetical protein